MIDGWAFPGDSKVLKRKKGKSILGWREKADLPELGVEAIHAKLDTGALTSTLHADHVEFFRKGRSRWVRFTVYPKQRTRLPSLQVEAPLLDERWIRSSNGLASLRPVIETRLELDGNSWTIELTLADRDMMGYRMLLGRQALKRRYLVDPARSFVAAKK